MLRALLLLVAPAFFLTTCREPPMIELKMWERAVNLKVAGEDMRWFELRGKRDSGSCLKTTDPGLLGGIVGARTEHRCHITWGRIPPSTAVGSSSNPTARAALRCGYESAWGRLSRFRSCCGRRARALDALFYCVTSDLKKHLARFSRAVHHKQGTPSGGVAPVCAGVFSHGSLARRATSGRRLRIQQWQALAPVQLLQVGS